jgi:hypothetical protein
MTTPQKDELSGIIESVSKLAGAVVGSAVITGKRIIGSAKSSSKGSKNKRGEKTIRAPSQKKKKTVPKTETKAPKTKKKKVAKGKGTGSSDKSGAPKKKRTASPAKKKKGVIPKVETTRDDKDIKKS